jgi:hypothetical protein
VAYVGVNTLSKFLKAAQKAVGKPLKGLNITNHSARVCTVDRLHKAGFDFKAISDATGHKSEAVEIYARPVLEQAIGRADALSVTGVVPQSAPLARLSLRAPLTTLASPHAVALVADATVAMGVGEASVSGIENATALAGVAVLAQAQLAQRGVTITGLTNCTINFG